MVQCYTLVNVSVLLLCFTADFVWNFGLIGIHAVNTNVTCYACPKGTLGNNSFPDCRNCSNKGWCQKTKYCHKCPSGYYQNLTGQTKCLPCPEGYFQKDSGKDSCDSCLPGQHQDYPGQTECKQCPKGFFSRSRGSQRCMSCGLGGFCNKLGCNSCSPCPAGEEANHFGAQNCTPCCPGYFKQRIGFDVCKLCKRGWYQVNRGQTFCRECPRGYYCPWQDSSPIKCEANQICPAGSFSPGSECRAMYTRNKETEECELSHIVYVVIAATLAVILAGIGFVIVRKYRRNNEQRQRLLERQHPVYTGW